MKVVILAGGYGTRLSEETVSRPKPMVEIGDRPILWHIMTLFADYGFNDFYVACGYKGEVIKQYFADYHHHNGDLSVSLATGVTKVFNTPVTDWHVHAISTGVDTNTGGRLLSLQKHIGSEAFMCTYGDGLCSVPIDALLAFHKSHGKLATVTAVHPPARFGLLELDGSHVARFSEKPQTEGDWINGGFFVFEPEVLDYVSGPESSLEKDVLEKIAADGQLEAFRHPGFFQPMDTLRERHILENLWKSGEAPWVKRP
ncbi:glucose-1-phosphate cytidylyltransferase [soil metagenome]